MEHSQAGVPSIPSETLLQFSSDLLTVHDRDGTALYANAACERLLGVPPQLAVGGTLFRLVHPEDRAALIEALVELRDHPGGVHVFRVRALHRDGIPERGGVVNPLCSALFGSGWMAEGMR